MVPFCMVIHVDDMFVIRSLSWMSWTLASIERQFGPLKCNALPFTLVGLEHCRLAPDSLFLHQTSHLHEIFRSFSLSTRVAQLEQPCTLEEATSCRFLVCSLLWLRLTRMALVLEVVLLQQHTVTPHIHDMCAALTLHREAAAVSLARSLHFGCVFCHQVYLACSGS